MDYRRKLISEPSMTDSLSNIWQNTLAILIIGTLAITCKVESDLPSGDATNGGLLLPQGFEAVVVVDSLKTRARLMAVNENGDIYVKARFAKEGGNVALRDTNGDGTADIVQVFGDYPERGTYGTAMRIYNGYLYFSTELEVYRQKLTPGKLIPESKIETVLIDDHAHGRHEHIAKPVTFDDQGFMYVPFGAGSNACQESNRTPNNLGIDPCPMLEDHGGIWKFDANKLNQTQRDGKRFATGLRSVVALDWNHQDKNLYVVQHGRDDLLRLWSAKFSPWQSAELPSEEFFRVKEGMDAGWPYCYYDQIKEQKILAPEYGGDGEIIGRCDQYEKPLIGFPGHWAPNDLFFYTGNQYPERYKNGAFIAFHGSTNRAPYPQAGYFIAFIPFNNGQPGTWEVFADGFAGIDPIINVSDAHYRPMGIAMGPDGSLYISDTEKGKIWRIMYKGKKENFGDVQLAEMEKRKSASNIRRPDEINDNLDKGIAVGGEKVYEVYCGTCHQKNGLGDSARFPPLAKSPWVTGDKNTLISIVLNGLDKPIEVNGITYEGVMPQHSFLRDEEIANVLTYIRQNFENTASAVAVEEVTAMRSAQKNNKTQTN
jgi:glucose/arabinose dehydrogenase/mono/diheme cytochrome c family protein